MTSLWREWSGDNPASVILLGPGTFALEEQFFGGEKAIEKELCRALEVFGANQKTTIKEHLVKLSRLLSKSTKPPMYYGNCLYLVTSATAETWYFTVLDNSMS
jgi:hypothetical protein